LTAAFVADSIVGVIELSDEEIVRSVEILPDLQNVEGVVKISGNMILIHDLEKTLSLDVKNHINLLTGQQNG